MAELASSGSSGTEQEPAAGTSAHRRALRGEWVPPGDMPSQRRRASQRALHRNPTRTVSLGRSEIDKSLREGGALFCCGGETDKRFSEQAVTFLGPHLNRVEESEALRVNFSSGYSGT